MHEGWKTYKLEELTSLLGDGLHGTPKYTENGDYAFINGNNLINGKIVIKPDTKRVNHEQYLKYKKNLTDRTLLVSINGTIGNVAIYRGEQIMLGKSACYFNVKENVDKEFIKQVISSNYFLNYLEANFTGSVIKNVSLKSMREFPINLPPLQEQKAIASILSALDDKIELNLQMNKTLEDMAMALYKHWFVDFGPFQNGEFVDSELGMIPKGWEVKRLDSLVSFSNGYAFKSKQLLKNEEEDCLHVFKMGHIKKGGGLKPDGTKSWVRKSDCIGLSKYILKVGDILMSMTDMKDNMTILGHTALMNENEKYIVNQRVGLLRIKNNIKVGYPFIFILTNSYDYIERLRSQANSGVQVNLSTDAIKSSLVVTPTRDINEKFQNIALPYFEQINQNAIENQTLTTLRDTLLPKLISGEVRVKDIEQTIAQML